MSMSDETRAQVVEQGVRANADVQELKEIEADLRAAIADAGATVLHLTALLSGAAAMGELGGMGNGHGGGHDRAGASGSDVWAAAVGVGIGAGVGSNGHGHGQGHGLAAGFGGSAAGGVLKDPFEEQRVELDLKEQLLVDLKEQLRLVTEQRSAAEETVERCQLLLTEEEEEEVEEGDEEEEEEEVAE